MVTTFFEAVRKNAEERADRLAYAFLADGEDDVRRMSFGEVDRRAKAIASSINDMATSAGERSILLYPSGLDFISGFFGSMYAGAIAVPAYPPDPMRLDRTLPRLRRLVADCDAKFILTTAAIKSMAEMIGDMAPELRSLSWIATDDVADERANDWTPPSLSVDDVAFLQYTSGSTSDPKGVVVTHGNLVHNVETIIHQAHRDDSVTVSWLPMYHDMGLIGCVLTPIFHGSPSVLMSPIDFLQKPFRWLRAISRHHGTLSASPNFGYEICVRKVSDEQRQNLDLSTWKLALNGAEPIRADTLVRFCETFGPCGFRRESFFPAYGLAESTVIVTGTDVGRGPKIREFLRGGIERHVVTRADTESLLQMKPSSDAADRREHLRVPLRRQASCIWQGRASTVEIENISQGGARLSGAQLPLGAAFTLRLTDAGASAPIDFRARVARHAHDHQHRVQAMGVRFHFDDESARTAALKAMATMLRPVDAEVATDSSYALVGAGHPLGEQTVLIVDPDSRTRCPADHIGEIWVRGSSVARGYWNNAQLTSEIFGARLADSNDGPFLRTGDLGFFHEGELFVAGRSKDVIIINGKNIYPHDIEMTVEQVRPLQLRPGSGAAFAVEFGSDVEVVIVQEINRRLMKVDIEEERRQARSEDERYYQEGNQQDLITPDQLVEEIRRAVADEHEVQVYGIVLIQPGTIPKTSSGKIMRRACQQQYLSDTLSVFHAWRRGSGADVFKRPEPEVKREAPVGTRAWLLRELSERLGISEASISTDKPFAHYGLDSKEGLMLLGDLAEKLSRSLSPTLFSEFPTIDALLEYLEPPKAQPREARDTSRILPDAIRLLREALPSLDQDRLLQSTSTRLIRAAKIRDIALSPPRWKPSERLRLLLVGYQGARNTGADVRVQEIVRQLRVVLGPERVDLTVLTINPELSAGYFEGAQQRKLPFVFPKFLYDECRRYHGVVVCEGSMFKSKFAAGLTTMFATALGLASAERKLSVGYGGEAGAMDAELKAFVREHCAESLIICRNQPSRQLLEAMGIRTRIGTDTAWTFSPAPRARAEAILRSAGWDGRKKIFLACPINPFWWPVKPNVFKAVAQGLTRDYQDIHYRSIYFHEDSHDARRQYQNYIEALSMAIERFRRRHDVFVGLVGMEQLDRRACHDVAEQIGGAPRFLSDTFTMHDLVAVLRTADVLLSSRYHAIVTSMPGLVPSAGVTMDERIRNIMDERGHRDLVVEVDDPNLADKLDPILERLWNERESIARGIGAAIPRQLALMADMGRDFVDEVCRVYPEFKPKPGGDVLSRLPPLDSELERLLERFG